MNPKLIAYIAASAIVCKGVYSKFKDYNSHMHEGWMYYFRRRNGLNRRIKFTIGNLSPLYNQHGEEINRNERYTISYLSLDCLRWLYTHSYIYHFQYCVPIYYGKDSTYYYTAYCDLEDVSWCDLAVNNRSNTRICTFINPNDNLARKPKDQALVNYLVSETRSRFGNDSRYKLVDWIR